MVEMRMRGRSTLETPASRLADLEALYVMARYVKDELLALSSRAPREETIRLEILRSEIELARISVRNTLMN